MNLIISQDLAQGILNYLIGRPYVEVFNFIEQLKDLKKVEDKPVEKK
jgi:hypothetical protein